MIVSFASRAMVSSFLVREPLGRVHAVTRLLFSGFAALTSRADDKAVLIMPRVRSADVSRMSHCERERRASWLRCARVARVLCGFFADL
jgi:hypothetical protein